MSGSRGFEVVGLVLGIFPAVLQSFEVLGLVTGILPAVLRLVTSPGYQYRLRRFGFVWGTYLYLGGIVNTDALQQNHWNINSWTDPEVLQWKASHLASCNAIAVAGAIFANIGLTALQLPGINAVHWSARACCSSSMVLGVASVVTAAGQHRTVGMLNSPLDIRLWLSRGRPKSYRDFRDIPKNFKSYSDLLHIPKIFIKPFDINTDKYDHVRGFQRLPLESSISALKETALPRHLLDLAVLVFLVGFGLYVLFLWLFNVDESGQSYRNVFIVFVITVGIHVIYDSLVKLARILDDDIRNSEFNTNTWGGFRRREKLSALQQELAEVQERVKIEHPSGQKFQDLLFQRQQDHEDVMETEGQTSATTNAQSSPASVRNFNSPPPAPALAPATAALPAAKQDLSIPNSSTNRRISPACKVDKYQAWHHYLIGYMKTQAVSNEHSSLLKIMEIKGNFEAEWDLAIATIDQETQQATTPW